MSDIFFGLIPSYFELWHIPAVFFAGMIAEGYAVILGSGSILTQFVLISLGMPLSSVVATDLAGCLGANIGVIAASPRAIWSNKRLLLLLAVPVSIGGVLGTFILTHISADILRIVIIIALAALLAHMFVLRKFRPNAVADAHVTWRQYPLIAAAMTLLGVYGNTLVVGTGTFQNIAFVDLLKIRVMDSIGIGSIIVIPRTVFSLVVTAIAGILAWPYLITLWVATYIGAHYVAKHVRKVPDTFLRALLIAITTLYLLYLVSAVF